MYLGKLVELGSADDIYQRPARPYPQALIKTIPLPDPAAARAKADTGITEELPSPIEPSSGRRLRTRCPLAQDRCAQEQPELRSFGLGHTAACHFPLQAPVSVEISAAAASGGQPVFVYLAMYNE
jgi:peptide/nickel transport system ATP-binding protein